VFLVQINLMMKFISFFIVLQLHQFIINYVNKYENFTKIHIQSNLITIYSNVFLYIIRITFICNFASNISQISLCFVVSPDFSSKLDEVSDHYMKKGLCEGEECSHISFFIVLQLHQFIINYVNKYENFTKIHIQSNLITIYSSEKLAQYTVCFYIKCILLCAI
jgi:hypothetical protein